MSEISSVNHFEYPKPIPSSSGDEGNAFDTENYYLDKDIPIFNTVNEDEDEDKDEINGGDHFFSSASHKYAEEDVSTSENIQTVDNEPNEEEVIAQELVSNPFFQDFQEENQQNVQSDSPVNEGETPAASGTDKSSTEVQADSETTVSETDNTDTTGKDEKPVNSETAANETDNTDTTGKAEKSTDSKTAMVTETGKANDEGANEKEDAPITSVNEPQEEQKAQINDNAISADKNTENNVSTSLFSNKYIVDGKFIGDYTASNDYEKNEEIMEEEKEEEVITEKINDVTEENKEQEIKKLKDTLQDVKDKQGIVGDIVDGIKSFTGIGSSSDKCDALIKDVENGKISAEEAKAKIEEFSNDQSEDLEIISNTASYVAGFAATAAVIGTGGAAALPLAVIAGTSAGGISKMGVNFLDRATNETDGDVLNFNAMRRDLLTGGLNGFATSLTMGYGGAINSLLAGVGGRITEGVISGSISGAITGSGGYVVDTILDDKKEFKSEDFVKATQNGIFSCGFAGGLANSFKGVNLNKVIPKIFLGKSTGVAAENTTSGSLSVIVDHNRNHNNNIAKNAIKQYITYNPYNTNWGLQ